MSGYQQALKKSIEMTKDLSREQLNMHMMDSFKKIVMMKEEIDDLKKSRRKLKKGYKKLLIENQELKEENKICKKTLEKLK